MPSCQAFNCTNEKGKGGKSFFVIPNPTKSPEKRRLCQQWITNLKNVKLKFETFVFNSSKLVCEDHFTADSYDRNLVAESLNFMPKKKKLLPTAVPTLINTTIRKRRKAKKTGKNCTIGDKKNKVTDTQTGEKIISRKKKKYKRVITQLPDNVKSNNDERSKMKEVTSSSLANNNMLKDQETQTIENTLHLPLPDNVKSNNDEVKIEGVTSSSLAVNNKIHVDQETQTGEDTPLVFPVQLGRNIVWAFISGSKEGNYSRYMGDNSTSHLLNDQVSVASLQTNNQETDRLNENQSIEPQLDNTDDCLTVLSKTMSRLEDLGVEIAAWVFVPNNNKSSRIHHMGSQRGREFIKSKPVINAQLHVFLQNSKRKGLDNGSSCFKDQQADDSSIQADLPMNAPCLVISRNKNGQKLKRKISSVYMGLDNGSSCFKDQQADDSSIQADLPMNAPCLVISRNKNGQKLKRKISSVYMGDHAYCKNKAKSVLRNKLLDHSRQPTSSSSLPAMDMDTFTKAKEIDLSKSFKFQNEEQDSNSILRDLNSTNIFNPLLQKSGIKNMTENTLLLDKHSSTAEKSNLEIRGDNLINKIKEEPVDYEYIEFQSVKPRETVTGSTVHLDTHSSIEKSNLELRGDHLYTHSIKEEPVDYEFIESEAVKPREIVAESTVHLDTHSSTVEKTNSSTNNIKEDTVDYEFTDFQEANNNNNNVTENTVQLDTHSSTAEKSTARLKEDSLSNDIKEEPIDYDFQEVKHRKLAELDSTECSEIAETEQSNTDDFGIRLVFDEEKTESSNNNPNIGGTIEGYKVFLNNANESIHHVTSGL